MTHITGGSAKREAQNAITEPGNHSTVVGKAIIHLVRIVRLQSKAHRDEFSKRRAWIILYMAMTNLFGEHLYSVSAIHVNSRSTSISKAPMLIGHRCRKC